MTFWETALASGIGAFAAFGFNLTLAVLQRRRDDIAAGNIAMAILRSKLTYVALVAKAWDDEHNQKNAGPFWWRFTATAPFPHESRTVDIASLGFLGSAFNGVISDVMDAELAYSQCIRALDNYRETYISLMWPAMLAAGVPGGITAEQAGAWNEKLPKAVLINLLDRYTSLAGMIAFAPGLLRQAGTTLRTTLDSQFNGVRFPSVEPSGRLAKANQPSRS